MFPLRPDGTRRSAAELFDGRIDPEDGDFIYGVGAFLARGRELTNDDKRLFLAALRVVAETGAAGHSRLDNFYFLTPGDRLVMFAPDRKDRLSYYRETAPASLTFSREEMGRIVLPENDPTGATRCTGLQKIIVRPDRAQIDRLHDPDLSAGTLRRRLGRDHADRFLPERGGARRPRGRHHPDPVGQGRPDRLSRLYAPRRRRARRGRPVRAPQACRARPPHCGRAQELRRDQGARGRQPRRLRPHRRPGLVVRDRHARRGDHPRRGPVRRPDPAPGPRHGAGGGRPALHHRPAHGGEPARTAGGPLRGRNR